VASQEQNNETTMETDLYVVSHFKNHKRLVCLHWTSVCCSTQSIKPSLPGDS